MTVTFSPPPKQIQQIATSCWVTGIPYEDVTRPLPAIACHFDDAAEAFVWHRTFIHDYGWAPYDDAASVSDT